MNLIEEFEAARPRLLSLAHRMLGSFHDAEDTVQAAWLRAHDADDVENPAGWFTTVVSRLCLDQLRSREHRGELPLLADLIADDELLADEAFLRREDVSRGLLVLLGQLSPKQRVAYVLHDLFAVPFDEVAAVLGTSATSAKKFASRARIRVRGAATEAPPADARERDDHQAIVAAFLDAARGGDIDRLVTLMAPDVVRTADERLVPESVPTVVRGARAVAEETRSFLGRIAVSVPMTIDGEPGAIIAPGGHPAASIAFEIRDGAIRSIAITAFDSARGLAPIGAT